MAYLGGAVELVEQVVQQHEATLRRPSIELGSIDPQDGVSQQRGKPGTSGVGSREQTRHRDGAREQVEDTRTLVRVRGECAVRRLRMNHQHVRWAGPVVSDPNGSGTESGLASSSMQELDRPAAQHVRAISLLQVELDLRLLDRPAVQHQDGTADSGLDQIGGPRGKPIRPLEDRAMARQRPDFMHMHQSRRSYRTFRRCSAVADALIVISVTKNNGDSYYQ
ncbi:hypothetical protein [Candidatus Mycolicibacterium alkanivorans]|uniref:Uncharacterized protein n=1 Tax=Candidatus Mycolicibacterium alkanivorans TaxID=2954114 RepID=A0ABS9Z0G8_9MYCO|nr:hypothetical protein [Candidatus Mycolicibacterium alkanivorans]MCI4676458.1 hypothetical protein [Candidatus Mycolicibacterium alkanivorans]